MSETFDPYSAWLSIPADRRPPDYYQLLGLAPLESDLFRIVAAADRQMGRVLPHLAGECAKAARLLLEELLTAKGFLITPAAKALYDAEFRQRLATSGSPEDSALLDLLGSGPPAEANRPRTTPPAALPPTAIPPACDAEAPPVVVPPGPPPLDAGDVRGEPLPEPERPAAPDSAEDFDSPRFDSRRLARDYQRRSSWTAGAIAFFVALAGVGLAAGVAWQQGFRLQLVAAESGQMLVPDEALTRDDAAFRSVAPMQAGTPRHSPVPPVQGPPNETVSESRPSAASNSREEAPATVERSLSPASAPAKPPGQADAGQPKSASATIDRLKPARPDAKQISKLTESLALARAALAARDLATADKQLEAAAAQATSPELTARVEAARLVRDYVDGFWKAVRESAKTLKGGEELTVRDKIVAIVDASPDEIVLRAAGQNRTYKLNDLPPHMATALAERWLDKNDANSKVYVGAFWLVDPRIEPGLARAKLAEAASAGATDAASLARLADAPW